MFLCLSTVMKMSVWTTRMDEVREVSPISISAEVQEQGRERERLSSEDFSKRWMIIA